MCLWNSKQQPNSETVFFTSVERLALLTGYNVIGKVISFHCCIKSLAAFWSPLFRRFHCNTHPIPSWIDGLGVAGIADSFLEGGRFMYPDSDKERCRMAGGRDPRELKRRTATSFSDKTLHNDNVNAA